MEENNFIYESPFSDETKKLRLNSLLASGLCLFVGLTGELPEKFSLFGVSFTSSQQNILGWFIFSVAAYLYLHFLSVACVEIAKWIHPFYVAMFTKKKLLEHPAFDETDFMNLPGPFDEQDRNDIAEEIELRSKWHVQGRLKYLYNLVYLKLTIEVIVPFVIGAWGLFELLQLITMRST